MSPHGPSSGPGLPDLSTDGAIDLADPTVGQGRRPLRPRGLLQGAPGFPARGIEVAPTLGPTDWDDRTQAASARPSDGIIDPWQPGTAVGSYRVVRRLGYGGMGLVYLAEHLDHGMRCALKTLRYADADMLDRFMREGQAQARVGVHGNVARIHEYGFTPDGMPYIAMELLLGGSLEARLKSGPMAVDEVIPAIAGVCRGLEHLHARGVVHRDLKPANVLFGAAGAPKLVDFGLALFEGAPILSGTGDVLGTPSYMAPEQALGDRDLIGPATDMFALGSILFECLTRQRAFAGGSHLKTLELVVAARPPQPAGGWPDEVQPWLRALCLELLLKDRAARPTASQALARISGTSARPHRSVGAPASADVR
jgi:serine/threonine protein kinase